MGCEREMKTVTKKDVMNALKKVIDPEIGVNIVDLGLIYGVKVGKNSVDVKMTLTTPHCPLHSMFIDEVEKTVKKFGVKNVKVKMVFDPPWTPANMNAKIRKQLGI